MSDMLVWPDFLNIPLRSGYTYSPADRRAKAEMEIGSRYRMLYDTDETVLNCDFALEYDKLAFFEAFEKHLLKQGSVWFKMPLLTAGGMEHHVVRFRERPKIGTVSNGFATVSMVLDVAERNIMSELATEFIYKYGLEVVKHISRLHEVLHVEMPGVSIVSKDL